MSIGHRNKHDTMLFNLSASALARLMQTHTDTHFIYNEYSSRRTIEQAELMRRCRGRSHSCTPTLRSVLACLTLHLCVGGAVVVVMGGGVGYGMSSIRLYTAPDHQCCILLSRSSPDCLQRDSLEVIHGSVDAITWLVA